MRNYIIYLIMIVFVGGHVLADLTPHFHDGLNGLANSDIDTGDNTLPVIKFSTNLATEILSAPSFDDCCSAAQYMSPVNDIHCIADCGLAASEFASYHPNPRLYLAPPNDISSVLNTSSDHFRPPIA